MGDPGAFQRVATHRNHEVPKSRGEHFRRKVRIQVVGVQGEPGGQLGDVGAAEECSGALVENGAVAARCSASGGDVDRSGLELQAPGLGVVATVQRVQDTCCPDERVAGEVEFPGKVEDARMPAPVTAGVPGQEDRLEVAHLLGDAHHLLRGELCGVREHRQAVAAVRPAAEDVNV